MFTVVMGSGVGGWDTKKKILGGFATPNYIQNSKTYMDCMNWKLIWVR